MTIAKIMNYVNKATNIKKLFRTRIGYMLKKIMGYSYKRTSSIDNCALTPERIALFTEIFYIQDFFWGTRIQPHMGWWISCRFEQSKWL